MLIKCKNYIVKNIGFPKLAGKCLRKLSFSSTIPGKFQIFRENRHYKKKFFLSVLFSLPCPVWPVQLTCPARPFSAVISELSCPWCPAPRCPIPTVLLRSSHCSPILTALSRLSSPTALSWLSCHSCLAQALLSTAHLSFLSCPCSHVLTILYSLSCPKLTCQADLPKLICSGCPVRLSHLLSCPRCPVPPLFCHGCPGTVVSSRLPSCPFHAVISWLPSPSFLNCMSLPDCILQLSSSGCPV